MTTHAVILMAGRALLALLFVLAGAAKIAGPAPFRQHMAQCGVPVALLYPVIALEIFAGLALLTGLQARPAALTLAGFCVLTALIFHRKLSDRAERTLFVKDLAIAGGLLCLAAA